MNGLNYLSKAQIIRLFNNFKSCSDHPFHSPRLPLLRLQTYGMYKFSKPQARKQETRCPAILCCTHFLKTNHLIAEFVWEIDFDKKFGQTTPAFIFILRIMCDTPSWSLRHWQELKVKCLCTVQTSKGIYSSQPGQKILSWTHQCTVCAYKVIMIIKDTISDYKNYAN